MDMKNFAFEHGAPGPNCQEIYLSSVHTFPVMFAVVQEAAHMQLQI